MLSVILKRCVVNPFANVAEGQAVLRENIDTQIRLSRELFDTLERLANLAEKIPSPHNSDLLKQMNVLKSIGDRLVANAERSRQLIKYVSS